MQFSFLSNNSNFFYNGLFDINSGLVDLSVESVVPTELVLENNSNGLIVALTGSNFSLSSSANPESGTINQISVFENGTVIGTITGVVWDLIEFDTGLFGIENFNLGPMAALFDSAAPITFDATDATGPMDMEDVFGTLFQSVVSGFTYLDSPFDARLVGTFGDDTFEFRGSQERFTWKEVEVSEGNDTYDFSDVSAGSGVSLDYDQDYIDTPEPVVVDIDSGANTGAISYGTNIDTLVGIDSLLRSGDGLDLRGSGRNDSFNVALREDSYISIQGGEGIDNYVFTIGDGSSIRMSFRDGAFNAPFFGVEINLDTGIIENDGFGNRETFALTAPSVPLLDTNGRIEVRGTYLDDVMIGSDDLNDSFITERGNDDVDGGEGFDRVRYDRSGVEAMDIDLSIGTASGTWNGEAFTDTLTSIENVRGSREGADSIKGDSASERFEGRGGDDTMSGGGGEDTIYGDEGHDLIRGNVGEDRLFGDDGNDLLRGQKNGDLLDGGDGDDNLKGGGGNDTLLGGEGRDFLNGGSRADSVEGGDGRDKLIGRSFDDTLIGGAGNDRLNAGGDDDRLEGGTGNDVLKGGDGADVFVFDLGFESDRIIQADLTEDRFEISSALANGRSTSDIAALAQQDGSSTVIDFGGGDVIRLNGVTDVTGFEDQIDIL